MSIVIKTSIDTMLRTLPNSAVTFDAEQLSEIAAGMKRLSRSA